MCLGVIASGSRLADHRGLRGRGRAMGLTGRRSERDALDRLIEAVQTGQARVPGPNATYSTRSPRPRVGRWMRPPARRWPGLQALVSDERVGIMDYKLEVTVVPVSGVFHHAGTQSRVPGPAQEPTGKDAAQ
jgi:hypothetical protein